MFSSLTTISTSLTSEKTVLRDRNYDLSACLSRNLKRRMARTGALAAFVMVSVGAGLAIGRHSSEGPQPAPIPVPFELADTTVVRNDVPMVWGPVPRPNIPSPRQSVQLVAEQ